MNGHACDAVHLLYAVVLGNTTRIIVWDVRLCAMYGLCTESVYMADYSDLDVDE